MILLGPASLGLFNSRRAGKNKMNVKKEAPRIMMLIGFERRSSIIPLLSSALA